MTSRRPQASILALLLGAGVAIAACGGTTTSTAPSSAATAAVPATEAPSATIASSAPSAASAAPATATASPSATAAPPTASPAAVTGPSAGYSCTYPFRMTGTTSSVTHVTDVRVGKHDEFDRIAFQFAGSRFPTLRLDAVKPPFKKDPSDQPLTVAGKSFVLIRLVYASGEGYSMSTGKATYTGPDRFTPRYDRLTSLVEAGDFEAHMSWVAGFTGPPCYRVTRLASPTRYVIDFQVP